MRLAGCTRCARARGARGGAHVQGCRGARGVDLTSMHTHAHTGTHRHTHTRRHAHPDRMTGGPVGSSRQGVVAQAPAVADALIGGRRRSRRSRQ